MTSLSTHVLDAARGVPAVGIAVSLTDPGGFVVDEGVTDADGRIGFEVTLNAGPHRLTFATGPWFAADGRRTFFPEVVLAFEVDAEQEHFHVALLLSAFAYTTYRGS